MKNELIKTVLSASIVLALSFAFSCSSDDGNNDSGGNSINNGSGVPNSSSSLLSSSSRQTQAIVPGEPITDVRNWQTYETVVIGKQTWMAKNLNYEAEGSKCYGEGTRMFSADSIARNCEIYGRLYSWDAAISACPEGWHLSSYAEWAQLADYLDSPSPPDIQKEKLMATSGWNSTSYVPSDDYGFAALPGGGYGQLNSNNSDIDFGFIYRAGYWWTATESDISSAARVDIGRTIWFDERSAKKSSLFSVRCVQGPGGCTAADNTDTHYCSNGNGTMKRYGSVTDKGGKKYKTVEIGEQTWMAENLDYKVEFSKCYDDKPENCEKYGRLYDWLAAMNNSASSSANPSGVQGVCPNGWHLPSKAEWETLEKIVGGDIFGGLQFTGSYPDKLKAASGREEEFLGSVLSYNGVDNYGFSALGGGAGSSSGSFYGISSSDYWWSATEKNASRAIHWGMSGNSSFSGQDYDKANFHSVRCVKD